MKKPNPRESRSFLNEENKHRIISHRYKLFILCSRLMMYKYLTPFDIGFNIAIVSTLRYYSQINPYNACTEDSHEFRRGYLINQYENKNTKTD